MDLAGSKSGRWICGSWILETKNVVDGSVDHGSCGLKKWLHGSSLVDLHGSCESFLF